MINKLIWFHRIYTGLYDLDGFPHQLFGAVGYSEESGNIGYLLTDFFNPKYVINKILFNK